MAKWKPTRSAGRSSPKPIRQASLGFLMGLILGVGVTYYHFPPSPPAVSLSPDFKGKREYPVVRVVDGDTVILLVEGKEERVRLLGVDTPESVKPHSSDQPGGPEASLFLKNLLEGEKVWLEEDPKAETKDRFGRRLAYLYRSPDGLFVNLEIIRQGYGEVYDKSQFSQRDLFLSYESQARKAGKGIWAKGRE